MGGTQRKAPLQPPVNQRKARVWDDSDHIELLAWLELCSQRETDFMDTSIGHLKQSTGKDFSWRQIRDKLKREWQNYGLCDQFEDVFTKGISAFNPLEDHQQSKLVERIKRLNMSYSHEISTPVSDSSTLSDISQPEIEGFHSLPPESHLRHRSIYSGPSDEPGQEAQMIASNAPSRQNTAKPTKRARVSPRKREASPKRSPEMHSTKFPILLPPSNSGGDTARLSMLEDQLAEKTSIITAQEQALINQESFILTLQTRLFHMQNENNVLVNCSRAAKAHRGNPDMQEQLHRQISTLKQQVKNQTQLEIDLEDIQTSQLGPSFREVISKFNSVRSDLDDACATVSTIDIPDLALKLGHDKDWNGTLELWAKMGSSFTLPGLIQHCVDMQISSLRLTRLLAASALCHLVFEPIFPTLLTIDSPLIDQYRRQILTKYGHRELYIVDSLAHKALISDGFFKSSTFKEMKTQLQNVFSHSMQWLLSPEHYFSDRHGIGLRSDEDIPPSVGDVFKQTLKVSLKLKVELMVTDVYFLLHFFKPGEPFDAALMEHDGTAFAGRATKRQHTSRRSEHTSREAVTLCLFPAVYASKRGIRAQNLEEQSSMQACVVDYTYFLNSTNSAGPQSWKLISKATVLVHEIGNEGMK